jgi:hypothetical protein
VVTLNEINTETDNRYGPLVIEDIPGGDVTLRNLIRCTENEMDQVSKLDTKLREAQKASDMKAALGCAKELLEIAAVGTDGERLLEALGDDSAKVMYVLELWAEATQAGEALRSDSSSATTATP